MLTHRGIVKIYTKFWIVCHFILSLNKKHKHAANTNCFFFQPLGGATEEGGSGRHGRGRVPDGGARQEEDVRVRVHGAQPEASAEQEAAEEKAARWFRSKILLFICF